MLKPQLDDLTMERDRLAMELEEASQPQGNSLSLFLSPERSGEETAPSTQITLGTRPEWLSLVLELPPSQQDAKFRATLSPSDGEPLWQSDDVSMDASGRVVIQVYSSWLEDGDYVLSLDHPGSSDEDASITRFTLRVRREPNEF